MMDDGSVQCSVFTRFESLDNNIQFSPKISPSDNDVDEKVSCLNVFYLIVYPNE